jgi:hypothetical protein
MRAGVGEIKEAAPTLVTGKRQDHPHGSRNHPIKSSEDKDPTHTIARISFSDLEDDEAILSDVVIFASISICH